MSPPTALAALSAAVVLLYLVGAAVDAGVALLAGGRGGSLLGPLPLLHLVWLVVVLGLLLGGFPAAEVRLYAEWGAWVLLHVALGVGLLFVLVLRRVGDAAGLRFTPAVPVLGAGVLSSCALLTWLTGPDAGVMVVVGAAAQVSCSLALAAALCRAGDVPTLQRVPSPCVMQGVAALVAITLAVAAAVASATTTAIAAGLAAALLALGTVHDGRAVLRATLAWLLVVAPRAGGLVPYLEVWSGDPATTWWLAGITLVVLPPLVVGQVLVWTWTWTVLGATAKAGVGPVR